MAFANVAEAIAWLDSHIDFESTTPNRRNLPSLDRMKELMVLLADPETTFAAIHITGTNGKGSTSAIATSLLQSLGLSVGTYTSPNLVKVNERIARNASAIDDEAFREVLWSLALLEPLLTQPPSRFELLTAAAFSFFAAEAVDVGVIEVGLGGTWDATNVLKAAVSVITNISYDHTEVLGPTLEGIARDKAGIAKADGVVVIGERDPDLVSLIAGVAREKGAREVWVRGREFACTQNEIALGGRLVSLSTPTSHYNELLLPMHGAHQGDNASCALAAVEALVGQPLSEEVVTEGLLNAKIAGRIEVFSRQPLVVIDGAHNVAGMEVLARTVRDEFSVEGERVLVVGMLKGRDPLAMLAPLAQIGLRRAVVTQPVSPRAMAAKDVADAARSLGMSVKEELEIKDAIEQGREWAGESGMTLIAGSLYLAGSARALLGAP
jgi:dihydrofolate synthase/folylpolyglutamate synthase